MFSHDDRSCIPGFARVGTREAGCGSVGSFGEHMDTSRILKVAVLEDGRTAVFPEDKKALYQYVYREAAGVYWEQGLGCVVSTHPGEWTPQQWYQHIVDIVRTGVGLQMVLTPETEYQSKEEGFGESIKLADQDLRR